MLLGRNTNSIRKHMYAQLITCRATKKFQTMKTSLVSILFADLPVRAQTISVQSRALPSTFKVLNRMNEPNIPRLSYTKAVMLYKTAVSGTVKRSFSMVLTIFEYKQIRLAQIILSTVYTLNKATTMEKWPDLQVSATIVSQATSSYPLLLTLK